MGSKTWRRLAIAAVVLVLGVVAIIALQRYQVSRMGVSNLAKAEEAEKAGDLAKAEELYLQHVRVFPEDFDAQVNFARVLLERSRTLARVSQAMQIYKEVLGRQPGRDDVRRSLVELQIEAMGEKGGTQIAADVRANLNVLQKKSPDDGDLAYLMGRYRQAAGEDREAIRAYEEAVAKRSKDRFDARQRMAKLYRGAQLNSPADADRVIDEMVKEEPEDFRTHLTRGRYRAQLLAPGEDPSAAEADFREAIRLAPAEADAYLELAGLKMRRTPPDAEGAAEILAQGLKAAPKSGRLHLTSATTKINSGDLDGGVKALRAGLEVLPDDAALHVTLADTLALQGATTELRDEVQELNRVGLPYYGDYYAAFALANARQWAEAKQILLDKLVPLNLASNPALRAGVNRLLAQCYGNLGDAERQRSYLAGAVRDAPDDLASRLTWIAGLVGQGETDRAIAEYRALADSAPAARVPLAALLIERNRRLEPSRRDWKEVEDLVARVARDEPSSSSLPAVLTAQMKAAQGLRDEAVALLDAARAKAPKDRAAVQVWITAADLKADRRDFDGAMKLLDEARESLGDSRELRVARQKYILGRGGPDQAAALVAATEGLDSLPPDQRAVVLEAAGAALVSVGARAEAKEIWGRAAELAPGDVRPRLQAFSLALSDQADIPAAEAERMRAEAEGLIADIRRIEGPDGYMARLAEVELLTWRIAHAADAAEKAKLRADARAALGDLRSRRPDWSVLPLATARLDELELDEAKDDADRRRRLGRMADLYRQAIEMGQHSLPVVRRATELLLESGRTAEVSQLWSRVPALGDEAAGATNIEKSILQRVIGEKNFEDAEAIVRQRVAARPDAFAERAMLVQLLIWQKKFDEAEAELRQAVAAQPADPERRILLVEFLVATNKIEQAEQAFAQVERAVGPADAPRTMAACAALIAQGCQATGRDAQKSRWIAAAKDAYRKAQAARPGEFAPRRAYVEFLLRMNLVDEVETELTSMLKPAAGAPADAADIAWARRTLALTHIARAEMTGDYQQALKALYLYAPPDKAEVALPEEVEDLRVLARVYAAQRIVAYRTKAAQILQKLVDEHRASEDDRYLLARIYRADGDWDKARAELRELVREDRRPTSAQELSQQVGRLTYYASELIDHMRPPVDEADVAEAQALIDRLKAFQPDAFNALALQVRLDKARGKDAEALAAIKAAVGDRPQIAPAVARALGGLAEKVGLLDEAESLLKRNATASPRLEDQLEYAVFLGRRGRIKDALDIIEPIWNASPNPEPATPAVVAILLAEQSFHDPDQIARVSGWIERAMERNPDATLLTIALGTIRDRQGRYSEAMDLYRKALAKDASEVVPLNNLAWLMTLQGDKGADPLKLINRAIQLRGPVPELLDTRAVVYLTNGDPARAVKDLEDAVAIDPSPSRHFHLARAYLAAGDQDAARRNLAKARDEGLKESDIHPLERPALAQVEKALK